VCDKSQTYFKGEIEELGLGCGITFINYLNIRKELIVNVCWSEWPHGLRQVCSCLPAEIVGSNPARGMDVCLL